MGFIFETFEKSRDDFIPKIIPGKLCNDFFPLFVRYMLIAPAHHVGGYRTSYRTS